MDLIRSQERTITFVVSGGVLCLRRGIHVQQLRVAGEALNLSGTPAAVLARLMLSLALDDPDPDAALVRAFAADVVSRLPHDGFELTGAGVVTWVDALGSAQQDDLRQEERPLRFDELAEYDDEPDDPAGAPVAEAGGGVSEGFEAAEDVLVAHATHATDSGGDPWREALAAEAGAGPQEGVYGEADDATHGSRGDGS